MDNTTATFASPENFYSACKSNIKLSKRNRVLNQRLNKSFENTELPELNVDNVGEAWEMALKIARKKRKLNSPVKIWDYKDLSQGNRSDPTSCFFWFVLRKRDVKELMPDFELQKYKLVCENMMSKSESCHEAHYAFARLCAKEGNYLKSLEFANKAFSISPNDQMYKVWLCVMKLMCAESRKDASEARDLCYEFINESKRVIEIYWGLLELSQREVLTTSVEIEPPEHYASCIKQLDSYFGYLAWSHLFIWTQDPLKQAKGENVLLELIDKVPDRPEAYLKLWNYYYYIRNDYLKANLVIEKAFLKLSGDNDQYSALFNIYYSKTLYRIKKFSNCFELLQLTYMKNPTFSVYLYHYGRLSIKSGDFKFLGSAIGALLECYRTCAEYRQGQVLFWLSKGYLMCKERVKAYNTMKSAVSILSKSLENYQYGKPYERKIMSKVSQLKESMRSMEKDMINIEILQKKLETEVSEDELLKYCSFISNFDPLEAEIWRAKIFWKLNRKQEAINLLYTCKSQSKILMKLFFMLTEYLIVQKKFQEAKSVSRELIQRCKDSIVPVQIWVKAHMYHARTLKKTQEVETAILVYKGLANVLPNLNLNEVNYTKALQLAANKQDLESAYENKQKFESYTELINISRERNKLSQNRRLITSTVIGESKTNFSEENPKQNKKVALFSQTQSAAQNKFKTLSIETNLDDETDMTTPRPHSFFYLSAQKSDHSETGFSICYDYSFLLKIGKTCAEHSTKLQEGLEALNDYLCLQNYFGQLKPNSSLKATAEFWKGVLLGKLGNSQEAKYIFQSLSETPNLPQKLKERLASYE